MASTEEVAGTAAVSPPEFKTYEEFWPYYVAMHSRPETRLVHAIGTITAGIVALSGIVRLRPKPKRLLLAPVIGYGFAWASHFLIEHNNPATFGYPAWSLQGDMEMLKMLLDGRDHELTEIAQQYLSEHPEHQH